MPINPAVNFNSYTTVNVPVTENGGNMGCGCDCNGSSGSTANPPNYQIAGTLPGTPPPNVPGGSGAGGVPASGDIFRSAGICIPLAVSKPFGSDGFSFTNFDILADLKDKLTSAGLLNSGETLVSARVNITGLAYVGLQVSVIGIALTPLPKVLTITDTQGTVNTVFSSEETIGATLLKTGVGFTALHYDQKGLSLNLSGSAGLKLNGEMPAANRLLDPLDSPPSQYNPAWLHIEVCDAVVRGSGVGGGGSGSGSGSANIPGTNAAPPSDGSCSFALPFGFNTTGLPALNPYPCWDGRTVGTGGTTPDVGMYPLANAAPQRIVTPKFKCNPLQRYTVTVAYSAGVAFAPIFNIGSGTVGAVFNSANAGGNPNTSFASWIVTPDVNTSEFQLKFEGSQFWFLYKLSIS